MKKFQTLQQLALFLNCSTKDINKTIEGRYLLNNDGKNFILEEFETEKAAPISEQKIEKAQSTSEIDIFLEILTPLRKIELQDAYNRLKHEYSAEFIVYLLNSKDIKSWEKNGFGLLFSTHYVSEKRRLFEKNLEEEIAANAFIESEANNVQAYFAKLRKTYEAKAKYDDAFEELVDAGYSRKDAFEQLIPFAKQLGITVVAK